MPASPRSGNDARSAGRADQASETDYRSSTSARPPARSPLARSRLRLRHAWRWAGAGCQAKKKIGAAQRRAARRRLRQRHDFASASRFTPAHITRHITHYYIDVVAGLLRRWRMSIISLIMRSVAGPGRLLGRRLHQRCRHHHDFVARRLRRARLQALVQRAFAARGSKHSADIGGAADAFHYDGAAFAGTSMPGRLSRRRSLLMLTDHLLLSARHTHT